MQRLRNYFADAVVAILIMMAMAQLACGATVPESVPVGKFVRVTLEPGEKAIVFSQDFAPVDIITTSDTLAFTGLPGRYAVIVLKGDEQPQQFFTKITGTIAPKPEDPPKPDVEPDPDTGPTISSAILPDVAGFHVMLVYESGTLPPDIPAEQHEIQYLPTVRDWLTKNTTPENGWAGWRVADPQAGAPQSSDLWNRMLRVYTDASAFPGKTTPWLLVNNGAKKKGYSGPMPKNAADFLTLMETMK